jgi:FKBP-type peptidyl-prolyl cis-trans isomerase
VTHARCLLLPAVLLLVALPACGGDEASWTTTGSGLRYRVLQAGEPGTQPKAGEVVKLDYVGKLPNGETFDSSAQRGPLSFAIGHAPLEGLEEAALLMTVGSKVEFVIPWHLAFGEKGDPPKVPPHTDLTYEMELLSIVRKPALPVAHADKEKTTDSGIRYEVLEAGEGTPPRADQGATLEIAFWSPAGELMYSSVMSGRAAGGLVAKLGLGSHELPFLQEIVPQMAPGARWRCTVPAKMAFGDEPIGRIPPGSDTIWVVKLVKVNDVPAFEPLDPSATTTTASGLGYQVIRAGEGTPPKASDTVRVLYTGWLENGTLFDSAHARGEPVSFPLGHVIRGWTEGLQLMKPGAIYRFHIPPELAYGPRPPRGSGIPPNAPLIFLVELLDGPSR